MLVEVDPKNWSVRVDGQPVPYFALPRFGPPLVLLAGATELGPVSVFDIERLGTLLEFRSVSTVSEGLRSFQEERGHWVPRLVRGYRNYLSPYTSDLEWASNETLHSYRRKNPGRRAAWPIDLLGEIKRVYWACKTSDQRDRLVTLAKEYKFPRQQLTHVVFGWDYWYV